MSSIPEFPEDTLLDLTKHLDVADLISLLSTCRAIRKAQLHKTLWIDALIRIRDIERQPYPLSNVKDLSTLSLHQLQRAAYQANQLMKNWRSDNPRPTSIRHFELPLEPWDQYFCLPGTPFIVTDTEGCMDCWDFRTGERVAHLEIPGLYLGKVRPCMEEEGKALICGSTGYGHKRLVAICIDYRDHAHVLLSHVVSPPTPLVDGWNWEPFYINPGIAGFSGRGYTMTWSMDPNAQPLQHEHEFEGEQTVESICFSHCH
ncbi:hypothetical protein B0H16DRAFT_1735832 [Mycena metata]|uniref:F-box domain-containing protein n=1 Tax=Mycena metata TaxID=1033252 RepID=A0AAD7MQ91_9AGAR|nr:hypothetical protein B0H16DRAFT_1735832 [Mycena metata]